jgi:hypothetical protein
LNGVLGLAEVLQEEGLGESRLDRVLLMHESGEALRALLNENFDLSDIESGSMQLAPRPTDIRKLIARTVVI